jgi:hypothetical protein
MRRRRRRRWRRLTRRRWIRCRRRACSPQRLASSPWCAALLFHLVAPDQIDRRANLWFTASGPEIPPNFQNKGAGKFRGAAARARVHGTWLNGSGPLNGSNIRKKILYAFDCFVLVHFVSPYKNRVCIMFKNDKIRIYF